MLLSKNLGFFSTFAAFRHWMTAESKKIKKIKTLKLIGSNSPTPPQVQAEKKSTKIGKKWKMVIFEKIMSFFLVF